MRNNKKASIIIALVAAFSILFNIFAINGSTFADSDILKKWVFQQASSCNLKSKVTQETSGEVGKSAFSGGTVLLPSYGFGGSSKYDAGGDGKIECNTALKNVIIPDYGKSNYSNNWAESAKAEKTMVDILGYKKQETADGSGTTITINATVSYSGTITKGFKDTPVSEPGKPYTLAQVKYDGSKWNLTRESITNLGIIPSTIIITELTGSAGDQTLKLRIDNTSLQTAMVTGTSIGSTGGDINVTAKLTNNLDKTKQAVNDAFKSVRWAFSYEYSPGSAAVYNSDNPFAGLIGLVEESKSFTGTVAFSSTNPASAVSGATYTHSGTTPAFSKYNTALGDEALYTVYSYYVKSAVNSVSPKGSIDCNATDFTNVEKVKLKAEDGKVKDCAVNLSQNSPSSISVNMYHPPNVVGPFQPGTLQDAINWLNNLSAESQKKIEQNSSISGTEDHDAINDSEDGETAEVEPTCVSSAGPLGWVLCPTAEGGAAAVDGIYSYLEGKLDLEPELFNDKSGAGKAWLSFIGIANIGLIIVLIIIIFSQLTGVGIDNYGIKKILPRLVIGILLVEASLIIVQGAVDISNILGSSFARAFKAIAMNIDKNGMSGKITLSYIVESIVGIAGVAGAAVPTIISVISVSAGGPAAVMMVLIPLIFAILTAIIAVAMFFLMIGLRSIIAIICVATAPLAFLCYILPNTQKVFKLWLNAFKGVLVVYPICGLIYGAGQLAKAIIANNGSGITFAMAMIAALVPFLPFLVAPTLLRGSMKALGDLGAKLQGLQRGAKSTLSNNKRNIMESDSYKERMFQGRGKTALRNVAKTNAKLQEARASGKKFKANMLERRLAANAHIANNYEKEMTDRRAGEMEQGFTFNDTSGKEVRLDRSSDAADYQKALEKEAENEKNGQGVDEYRVSAIFDKMVAMGEDGTQAIEDSLKNGNLGGKTLRIVARKVMSGEGNFKNKNRTTFNAFKSINSMSDEDIARKGTRAIFQDAENSNTFDWLRSENITNLDENELRRFAAYATNNPTKKIQVPDPINPGTTKEVQRMDLFNNVMKNLDRKTWNNMQQKQRDVLEAAWNQVNANPFNPV